MSSGVRITTIATRRLPWRVVALVATLAIGASVAWSFVRSSHWWRSREASLNVMRLCQEAHSYYMKRARGAYNIAWGSLPASVDRTPSGVACELPEQRFPGNDPHWESPTWKALSFSISGPHFYQYRFESDGAGFTVTARGDLNCNGRYSLFACKGNVDSDGNIDQPQLFTRDALE